ncbi:AMP-binding protein [Gordonia malaquae]|uniref:AMP-binding protein n=1 Tax=Gordonia malaquae TaxID=410332 RepID=UPI0030189CF4
MNRLRRALGGGRVAARQVLVLQRAGLIDLRRPTEIVFAASSTRTYGPVAGPVRLSSRRDPDNVAVIDATGSITYRELDLRTDALAREWSASGIGVGSVVAVMCRDHRGLIEALIVGAKVGARVVLMNTGFGRAQFTDVALREGVDAIVFDDEFAETVADSLGTVRRLSLEASVESRSGEALAPPSAQGGFVILTGGTTGTPKGVPRRVESPLAAAQFLDKVPLRRGGVTLLCAPLFHGTALSQLILSMALGCTVVLHGRFDAARAVAQIERHRAYAVVVVPTMLRRILDLGDALDDVDTSSLRVVFSAGAALPTSLGDECIRRLGPVIHNFYGCTETGTATIATPDDWVAEPGTVGRPPLGITVHLYSEGRIVTEPGVTGTVHVGNTISFTGYSGGGGKSIIDGLMSTGDVGHWSADGRLFIDGRDDDMIVSGGENVFPGEIEDYLYTHPRITEAAVIGVSDEEFGQRLSAFVVADGSVDEAQVKTYVRDGLARFKAPRDVHFVDDLPRTATGKTDRAALALAAERTAIRSRTRRL